MEFLAVVINVKQRWLRIPLKDQAPFCSDHDKTVAVENLSHDTDPSPYAIS
jgi:hypothetical protein